MTQFSRRGPAPVPPDATEFRVRMRDGVHLATDVYLPAGDLPPGPTIVTRLPYDKNGEYTFMPTVARYFVAHGYRVVVQDVRGKFRSEGETLQFVNEANDGYDTLQWVTQQPWSDGTIGMWGDSYYGFTQWAAASTGHPALRAMVPRVTGTRLGELPVAAPGEVTHDVEMTVNRCYPLTIFHDRDMLDWELDLSRRPLADQVEEFFAEVGSRSASYDLWFPHPVTLRRFPDGSPFDAPAVPVLMTIGWWDNCAPWQWSDHHELQARPAWERAEYLLLEGIDHENHHHSDLPAVRRADESEATLARYLDPAVEFFDVFLRGADRDIPRVRWQLANSGETALRTTSTWPPPDATPTTLCLHDGVKALGGAPGGTLAAHGTPQPAPHHTVEWIHDASDPVPSPAANAFEFLAEYPDERDLAERPDVLVFSTEPAEQPWLLAGAVTFDATVGSDGPEIDVFARLTDVSAEGAAHLVARGQLTLITPTPDHRVTIDLGHVGYHLPVGHRLRLTIASSDAPEFVPAPGTGEHRWLAATTTPNRQRLHLGGESPAALTLWMLPSSHLTDGGTA